jgi:MOSC domain-containing protein YiiM
MTIVSLFVGTPRSETRPSGKLFTAGVKASVSSAVLRLDGFEGDGVADRRHHGGADRTACVYPAGHYAWWNSVHGYDLLFGAFSENLTVEGVREDEICIGDIVRIGAALAQVTLPRDPCPTIDRITEISSLHRLAKESGKCGFHMRTLEEGLVRAGDLFEIAERNSAGVTVASVLDLYHGRSTDRVLQQKLQNMPEFAEEGKRELTRRLGA